MKKFILCIVLLLTLNIGGFAQNNVIFNVHHKLAFQNFELNMAAKNNIDHDFNVSRLQYYISGITIQHDGGQETQIEDTWILVNANQPTSIDLGELNIDLTEKIKFHIGVGPDHNHLDPASYPAAHPLAPIFPSMHWGWASGYRFIAIEGQGGAGLNQTYQLHGLGDDNYFETEFEHIIAAQNGVLELNVYAEYTRILENINVNAGVIVHGENDEAKQALENMRDYVFSGEIMVSTVDFSEVNDFQVFPNPAQNGAASFKIEASENLTYQVSVTNILGQQIQFFPNVQSNQMVDLKLENKGLYLVNLVKEGATVLTEKLMVD